MKAWKRTAALFAAAVMAFGSPASALAAAPAPDVDETLYVNTDYYGTATAVNVVKGISANGQKSYTDYGTYLKLVNMSTGEKPEVSGDAVTWQLPEGNARFYCQGTLENDAVELPWNFDISYRLNGVPADPEKLAGASGQVEINVKAVPNDRAEEYYKNNMMLVVLIPLSLEDNYSFDAPGAQIQNLGTYTAAMFMALPGEEGDFTVRIGSDDFQSMGVMMTMAPGTLDDLTRIKDLKEAKDTWRKDADRMYDAMDSLLASMENMKEDMGTVRSGIGNLDTARGQIAKNRKQVETLSTAFIDELQSVTDQTAVLIPYLDTAQSAVMDINADMDAAYATMSDMQDELDTLYRKLRYLKGSLNTLADVSYGGEVKGADKEELLRDLRKQLSEINALQGKLKSSIAAGKALEEDTKKKLAALEQGIASSKTFRYAESSLGHAIASDSNLSPQDKMGISQELAAYKAAIQKQIKQIEETDYTSSAASILTGITDIFDEAEDLDEDVSEAVDNLNVALEAIGNVAGDTGSAVNALRGVTDELIYLLDDGKAFIDTMDSYVPDMLDGLADSKELMNRLHLAMGGAHDLLSVINRSLIDAGDSLDAGTRESLKGLMGTLDHVLDILDDVKGVREAGAELKKTLDGELDELEEETNFLNIDPDAPKLSFTSPKNGEPHTLQIVVRTGEISDEDKTTDISDRDPEVKTKVNPLRRMWNVFVKMGQAMAEIFKNR